eukprot:GHVN01102639.1.p1 GENE.GHVN01102639.1~~GHVN01102639.1.p1  ORF type:complete len:187 (-),score=82.65 GHVN01102639.1:52-612(-)
MAKLIETEPQQVQGTPADKQANLSSHSRRTTHLLIHLLTHVSSLTSSLTSHHSPPHSRLTTHPLTYVSPLTVLLHMRQCEVTPSVNLDCTSITALTSPSSHLVTGSFNLTFSSNSPQTSNLTHFSHTPISHTQSPTFFSHTQSHTPNLTHPISHTQSHTPNLTHPISHTQAHTPSFFSVKFFLTHQ